MRRHNNSFRDGKVHVQSRRCKTCIFHESSPLKHDGTTERMTSSALRNQTAIICHSTLDEENQAVCRGFFDNHSTVPLRLAQATECLEFVS